MNGPVQVLVVGFEAPSFSGEVVAELTRLRERDIVRLVDILLLTRRDDGTFETLPPPPGADPFMGVLVADLLTAADGAETGPTDAMWSLEEAVPPGTTAAVALLEHLWARPLVEAIRRAGGRPLEESWLTAEDAERLAGGGRG